MNSTNDPLGNAILDYAKHSSAENITVHSDLCDDDVLPVKYLFRSYNEMPELEQKALNLCRGNVLEVGAGTGCHASHLNNIGLNTFSIDTSNGSIEYITNLGLACEKTSFLELKNKKFDTILILMNGLGLAGKLNLLHAFLEHAKSLLKPGGQIITDSSDIRYLYQEEDGGTWIDLNSTYAGEMEFQMEYKDHKSDWFPWVYVDFETLQDICLKSNLTAIKLMEDENFHYLTQIKITT